MFEVLYPLWLLYRLYLLFLSTWEGTLNGLAYLLARRVMYNISLCDPQYTSGCEIILIRISRPLGVCPQDGLHWMWFIWYIFWPGYYCLSVSHSPLIRLRQVLTQDFSPTWQMFMKIHVSFRKGWSFQRASVLIMGNLLVKTLTLLEYLCFSAAVDF